MLADLTAPLVRAQNGLTAEHKRLLIVSQALAVGWWCAAVVVRTLDIVPVWYDQERTFTQVIHHFLTPYADPHFVNPPWTAIILAPFGLIPLPLAALIQLCLYFAILALIMIRLGGGLRTALVVFTSFMAFDAALELNIEWIVALGLLVPAEYCLPFLLVKPQIALGYAASFDVRTMWRAGLVMGGVLLVSFVVWGFWPPELYEQTTFVTGQAHNLAPIAVLPWPVSVAVGLWLEWRAFRRHDPILGVLGWMFLSPYLTLYSILLPLTMLALRWFRLALIINLAMWSIYGGVIVLALLR